MEFVIATWQAGGATQVALELGRLLVGRGHRVRVPGSLHPYNGNDPQTRPKDAPAAIAGLPCDFRDVLVAVDITGLSYRATARALRIREGTVMSRLYRARQQVVRRVEHHAV